MTFSLNIAATLINLWIWWIQWAVLDSTGAPCPIQSREPVINPCIIALALGVNWKKAPYCTFEVDTSLRIIIIWLCLFVYLLGFLGKRLFLQRETKFVVGEGEDE